MSANTIITSTITGGTNNHTTVAEEANSLATDFVAQGVVGAITLNTGSSGTGSFCVNADATPDMGVTVKAGQAYITATPSSQDSQVLRARASADYTSYTINANSSGVTKYDWIYLSVNPTNANAPDAAADNVTSIYTSRSSSNTTDNGTPPTYGLVLAVVTVANGASSITNSNVTDKRVNTSIGTQGGSLIVTQQATGDDAIIQAAGQDANINLTLYTKGTGAVKGIVDHLYNPYKFSVYRNASLSISNSYTLIPFDTKEYDTGNNVDIVTHKGRFTAPVAGFYQLSFLVACLVTDSDCVATLYKNGTIYKWGNEANGGGTGASMVVQAAASDYFEVYAVATSGTGVNVGATPIKTWYSGFLMSAS